MLHTVYFQTDLKWVGEPVKEDGKKKYYKTVRVNEDEVKITCKFYCKVATFRHTLSLLIHAN